MKRIMIILAMSLCVTGQSLAATPRVETIVSGNKITLGDVFKGIKTRQESFYLAPSPAPGKKMVLYVSDLTRISEALNLGWVASSGLEKTTIRRLSNNIGYSDIKAALNKTFKNKLKNSDFEIDISNKSINLQTPYSLNKAVHIKDLQYDISKGLFQAIVSSDANPKIKRTVQGKLYLLTEVPVLRDTLRRGELISKNDISYLKLRVSTVRGNVIANASDLIGQTPKRNISAMKPIYFSDIKPPMFIKRGDLVLINFNSKYMSISTQGKAIGNGFKGDLIRIENLKSKKIITAVVTGYKTASITPLEVVTNLNLNKGS